MTHQYHKKSKLRVNKTNSALETYTTLVDDCIKTIDDIKAQLTQCCHYDKVNWGNVGSMGHIHELLLETNDTLKELC